MSELQERLLRLLDTHRVLTTGQLMAITSAPERTTEYRMAVLAKRGLVGRVRPPRGRGTHPWHWWLTPAGARLITGTACAEDRGGPNPLFVRHAAATADMWLALQLAGPAAGLELHRWWRDNEGWTEWQPSGWGVGGRVRRVTSDATAHLTVASLTAAGGGGDGPALGAVLIEVDLATMTQQRLGYKLARYRDYAADQAWRGAHPHCPVLLVLTTTPARAATFLRGAAKLLPAPTRVQVEDDWPYEAGRLVVAACGHVRDPKVAVTERVWMLPGDTAEITLTDLLADRVQVARRAHAVTVAQERRQAAFRWDTTVEALARDRRATPALAGDPAAQQVLQALQAGGSRVLGGWAAGAGPARVGLIGWWEPYATTSRYGPAEPPPADVLSALAAEYSGRWKTHAARLAAATGPVAAEAPLLARRRHPAARRTAPYRNRTGRCRRRRGITRRRPAPALAASRLLHRLRAVRHRSPGRLSDSTRTRSQSEVGHARPAGTVAYQPGRTRRPLRHPIPRPLWRLQTVDSHTAAGRRLPGVWH